MNNRNRTTQDFLMIRLRNMVLALLLAVSILSMPTTVLAAEQASLISEVKEVLEEVHIGNVSGSDLEDAAIDGMIKSLNDPYTEYMTDDEWNSYQNDVEQQYVGIGMRLGEDDFGVYALDVFPSSPAEEAGIVSGDYIVAVDGQSAIGKSTQEIVDMIIGDEFTKVEVTILSGDERKTLSIIRRSVQVPVVSSQRLGDGYGYIKIDSFSREADEQFAAALENLKEQGLQGLVVDMRNNPGGYVDTVRQIAKQFIEDGVLMNTRDKHGLNDPVNIRNGQTVSFPVAILANERSASGAEVFAGAMQDYDKAIVIGVQTYGKGSVQSIIPLQSGGVLKATIQEYLTPNGRRVNHVGIAPDVEVQGALPQLITGLRKVGMSEITLKSHSHGVMIHDVNFSYSLPYIEYEGRYYVHSRVLGALSGLQVSWDGVTQQVSLRNDDINLTYGVQEEAVMQQNGFTFIDVDLFAQQVSELTWSAQSGQLILSIQTTE